MQVLNITTEMNKEKELIKAFFSVNKELQALLVPFMGKKIVKAGGSMIAKIAEHTPRPVIETKEINLHHSRLHVQYKSLYCKISLRFYNTPDKNGYRSCYYAEHDFYIGRIDEDKLTEIFTDFKPYEDKLSADLSDLLDRVAKVEALIKEAESLQAGMPHYAKYVLPYVWSH